MRFVAVVLVGCAVETAGPARSPATFVDDRCEELARPNPHWPGKLQQALRPGEPDADMDCIADARDRCPSDPEDHDNHDDNDGCPDPDNDGDGVPDVADQCPTEAGTGKLGCP